MSIKKHIPNAITCCNLLCGCLAITQAFEGNLVWASYLVGLAAIFDFFDGFAARLLRVASPIGKDLDSLADMVTFGVVPGVIMYQLIIHALNMEHSNEMLNYFERNHSYSSDFVSSIGAKTNSILYYIAFIIPVFSAIRLAKFNNDIRQTSSFIGLPTPANAILICSLPLIFDTTQSLLIKNTISNSYVLIGMSIVLSFLLIAEIPLFALKFRSFTWAGNRTRFIFLGLSLLLLIIFQYVGIPIIIVLYVLMSMNSNFFAKRKKTS